MSKIKLASRLINIYLQLLISDKILSPNITVLIVVFNFLAFALFGFSHIQLLAMSFVMLIFIAIAATEIRDRLKVLRKSED